jgi:ribosomal protein S18 acetylase RimI-like enzyme
MPHQVTLRLATEQDYDFVYHVLKTTMQAYVEQAWGWDEEWQQAYFNMRFTPSEDRIIVLKGRDIGVISVQRRPDEILIAKIYILPPFQGQGIGTQLIRSVLDDAFEQRLPVALRVLKVNPAQKLYQRLGFNVVEETETRYDMRADPPHRVGDTGQEA